MKLLNLDEAGRVRQLAIVPDGVEVVEGAYDYAVSDQTPAEIGWIRQPDGSYAPPAATVKRIVSRREFARLFTAAERIAIRTASATNPQLADLYELMTLDETVNLDHPDVAQGIGALVAAGLLTQERGAAIIAGTPPV